jgi:hypothetical protein
LVEKDYWITHTLWALEQAGLDLWFKGGTSLSKGFGIIKRFSEDLDLKIEPGSSGLPSVARWKGGRKAAVEGRLSFFKGLAALHFPGLTQDLMASSIDDDAESANLTIHYPGRHLEGLPTGISPFILLEAGDARVRPCLRRTISSMIHDHLEMAGALEAFANNRPAGMRCIHPKVTLIEKLDAIMRRFTMENLDPVKFVRHYEDAAHIIRVADTLPPLDGFDHLGALVLEMMGSKQIRRIPDPRDPGFNPDESDRWNGIRSAHKSIGPMFWGTRLSLEEATAIIRTFLGGLTLKIDPAPRQIDPNGGDPPWLGFEDDPQKQRPDA